MWSLIADMVAYSEIWWLIEDMLAYAEIWWLIEDMVAAEAAVHHLNHNDIGAALDHCAIWYKIYGRLPPKKKGGKYPNDERSIRSLVADPYSMRRIT